jgi:hypothetical protein
VPRILNGNHASIHGAQLTADRFGQANSAFFLDGQQAFLEAPNSSALNSDYATVAFWAKPASIPGQGEVYLISFGGWQERYRGFAPRARKVYLDHQQLLRHIRYGCRRWQRA